MVSAPRATLFILLLILILNSVIFYKLGQRRDVKSIFQSSTTPPYSYYVCTQVLNESEKYLTEWIKYQLNIVGFKNICLINVGETFNKTFLAQYSIGIIHKHEFHQEFNYCLSCFDQPMKSDDLLFIQDIDEFLNVKQADVIFKNYHKYDKFHFQEIRYGYIYDMNTEMINNSLLETNVYRKPHKHLGEYISKHLQDLFNCTTNNEWYSCDEGFGKEMIKVGKIRELGVHFHQLTGRNSSAKDTLYVDMKQVRLNHYIMPTREEGIKRAAKWNKRLSRMNVINSNKYFNMIFDDTIRDSKKLI
ncbi:unnamed protein product [Adineta ricciae]|uniref:Uncharacterized protein n=1 Tax=Adineta ricciae TaxID=249248 RepID=A0A814ID05_ADIRI|nr:unnamed protein product [Adineta ricciae]CAF1021201.1 unnamed protein product [Adineta ricciae]